MLQGSRCRLLVHIHTLVLKESPIIRSNFNYLAPFVAQNL